MKKLLLSVALLVIGFANAQVKIGNNPTSINATSLLELESTTQGFLPSRMTEAQRIAIATPAQGLIIYCTNCGTSGGEPQYYNGTAWVNMIGGAAAIDPTPRVTIGTQVWAIKNLDVTKYRDGTVIPEVTDPTAWVGLTTGAWCYYNNDSENGPIYGKLYNWYAVNDPRGLAPTGYHIPTDTEWTTLTTFLDGEGVEGVAGGKMKETGTTLWNSPNTGATNSSGFTGLPGGLNSNYGMFYNISYDGYWWSSTEFNTPDALFRTLSHYDGFTFRYASIKANGFSVRCLRD